MAYVGRLRQPESRGSPLLGVGNIKNSHSIEVAKVRSLCRPVDTTGERAIRDGVTEAERRLPNPERNQHSYYSRRVLCLGQHLYAADRGNPCVSDC